MQGLDQRLEKVAEKEAAIKDIEKYISNLSVRPEQLNDLLSRKSSAELKQSVKLKSVLLRPNVHLSDLEKELPGLKAFLEPYDHTYTESAEIALKYEGYLSKEREMVEKMNRLEALILKDDMNYANITSLSAEAREKLHHIRPRTLGQASRISGVSPSDISVLLVHIGR